MEQLKTGIQQAEVAAEALKLTTKTGIELDRRRQGNRECLRALRKQDIALAERQPGDPKPPANSFQFRPGGVICRMTRGEALHSLEQDQQRIEQRIGGLGAPHHNANPGTKQHGQCKGHHHTR